MEDNPNELILANGSLAGDSENTASLLSEASGRLPLSGLLLTAGFPFTGSCCASSKSTDSMLAGSFDSLPVDSASCPLAAEDRTKCGHNYYNTMSCVLHEHITVAYLDEASLLVEALTLKYLQYIIRM